MAWIEALARMNPFEWVFWVSPEDRLVGMRSRWEYGAPKDDHASALLGSHLGRSDGWWAYAAWRALIIDRISLARRRNHRFTAPFATGSRGPILGMAVVICGFFFCRWRRLRPWSGSL